MPRHGIDEEDVLRAARELEAEGRIASPTNIRLQLKRGSFSTIQRLLARVREMREQQRTPPAMCEALQRRTNDCIATLWSATWTEACRRIEALEHEHRAEVDSLQAQLVQAQNDAGRLEFEVNRLATALGEERMRLASMSDSITQATTRAHALEAVVEEHRCERRALLRGLRGIAPSAVVRRRTANAPTAEVRSAMNEVTLDGAQRKLANSQ